MSKHWTEKFDAAKHHNRMWGVGEKIERHKDQKLDPDIVYFVQVCGFTFEFHSIEQIEICLEFYQQKIHPSRLAEGAEKRKWVEKVPRKFKDNHHRPRVVKALGKALVEFRRE